MIKQLVEIYMYDDNHIFSGTQLVNDIREVGMETKEGLVLPEGLTSIKPPSDLYIASGVSPKFTGDKWVEINEGRVKNKKFTMICVNKLKEIMKVHNI